MIWANLTAFIGSVLLAWMATLSGTFTYLRKQSLTGDVVSHSILPGICLAFLLTGEKHPVWLLAGGMVTGGLSIAWLQFQTGKNGLKADTMQAVVLSVFFGAGTFLLSYIQGHGNAAQSGLNNFLFGRAAAITRQDVVFFGAAFGVVLAVWLLFFRLLFYSTFDRDFAKISGLSVRWADAVQTFLMVITICLGITTVGVVLISALLILPPLAGRACSNRVLPMTIWGMVFSTLAALSGVWISASYTNMPTGPWIVLFLVLITVVSIVIQRIRKHG